MSITPLPVGPSALPVAPAGDLPGAPGDGSFAALVAQLLEPGPVGVPTVPVPDVPADATGQGGEEPGDPSVGTGTEEIAGQLIPTVWASTLAALVPVVQAVAPDVAGEPGAGATAAPATGPVGPTGEASSVAPLPTPRAYDGAAPGTAATVDDTVPSTGAGPAPAGPAPAGLAPAGDAPAASSGPDAGSPAAAPSTVSPAAAPVGTPAGPVTAPAVPLATAPAAAEGARPVPVVSQVVPEVTRLVSRGDGVHRLTMRLQPEGLGDVRVTLTVRDGQVDVRLAAGDDARRALLEGAPELRRVLELTGMAEARVVVRDLAGTAAPSGQQGWSHAGNQSGNPAGQQDSSTTGAHGGGGDASGRGEAGGQDQHAGTRGGAAARDGHTDGATALRPDPAGRAPRGVDLTM